ncbi:unnamed protein product, partial [Discosporangium mesarthrocarpum]
MRRLWCAVLIITAAKSLTISKPPSHRPLHLHWSHPSNENPSKDPSLSAGTAGFVSRMSSDPPGPPLPPSTPLEVGGRGKTAVGGSCRGKDGGDVAGTGEARREGGSNSQGCVSWDKLEAGVRKGEALLLI